MNKGVFEEHRKARITYDDHPDIADKIWMDKVNNIIYSHDPVRNSWLSSSRNHVIFFKKGRASGMCLPLSGTSLVESSLTTATTLNDEESLESLESIDKLFDIYMPGQKATIMGLFCRSDRGNHAQRFELRKNGECLYSFSYDGQHLFYINNSLNLELEPYDKVQLYVYKEKKPIKNTICRLETAWRYA